MSLRHCLQMMCGPTASAGETILQNEQEVEALAAALGCPATYWVE